MDKELIRRTVYGAARRLEIEYLLNRKPRHMSWGQRQRVALGRALCADHRILLLDEPFSGADPELRQELNRLVRELQQERGFTCLFCTHNLEDAFSLCSRLILMEDGSVLQSGAPEELLTAPRSRASAAFFVNDPYSFLSGKFLRSPGGPAVRVGDQTLSPLSCAPDALPDGGGVTVGCRSSQVRIVWGEGQPGLPGTLECSELRPGGGVLYTFRTPSGDVQALSQEALSYYTGAKAGLQINAGAAVLFRTEDGRALARKEG
jgi:ABC-type sugar transport system ATPase subunit